MRRVSNMLVSLLNFSWSLFVWEVSIWVSQSPNGTIISKMKGFVSKHIVMPWWWWGDTRKFCSQKFSRIITPYHQKVARLPSVMCPPSILGFDRWMCVERESLVGWLVARLPWLPVASCQPFMISLFAVWHRLSRLMNYCQGYCVVIE